MSTAETSSQERFVVFLAFFAGLALFAWLFFGSTRRAPALIHEHPEIRKADRPVLVAPESGRPVLPHDGETVRLAKLEKRIDALDVDLSSKVAQFASAQNRLLVPVPAPVAPVTAVDPDAEGFKILLNEQAGTITGLTGSLDAKSSELSALQLRLGQIEASLAKPVPVVNPDQALLERIRVLELQLGRLRSDTAQSRLFVDSGENLGGKAALLFGRLQLLKDAFPPAVLAEYQKIDPELQAKAVVRVRYDSAESEVPEKDRQGLEQLVDAAPEGSYFLVAGYADMTGEPEANRILSSKRASNVAELLDRRLKRDQTARAVYLGQTSRFGPDEENRVVEIWLIQP